MCVCVYVCMMYSKQEKERVRNPVCDIQDESVYIERQVQESEIWWMWDVIRMIFTWMTHVSCYVTAMPSLMSLTYAISHSFWSDSLHIHVYHVNDIWHPSHLTLLYLPLHPNTFIMYITFTCIMWMTSDNEKCRYRESDPRECDICVCNRHEIWWMSYTGLKCRHRESDHREWDVSTSTHFIVRCHSHDTCECDQRESDVAYVTDVRYWYVTDIGYGGCDVHD